MLFEADELVSGHVLVIAEQWINKLPHC